MIGETLGRYRIDARLGAGGMGVVYRAHDDQLQRLVAIKIVGGGAAGSAPEERAHLLEEARAASALNHPNICTVHEVGEHQGRTFIVMEYVQGRPLSQLVPHDGLPLETVTRYGAQVADAVAHAHQRGVIHRDLKTANIVISSAGSPKVLDFGLAARVAPRGSDTQTQSVDVESRALAGTPAYLAPELLVGQSATAQTDIWAVGVVLYEIATGRLPFAGRSEFELTAAILRAPPDPFPPHVGAALRAVILRCLAKEPEQRYQHVGEVRAALEAIGSTAGALPVAPRAIRSRRAAAAAAAFVAAGAALTGWVWLRPSDDPWSALAREGRFTRILSSQERVTDPALSPDGRTIAYVLRTSAGSIDLYVSRVAGGAGVRLTDDDALEDAPRFSPDGELIAFTRRAGADAVPEVRVVPALGGDVVTRIPRAAFPAWSPDGRRLAYVRANDRGDLSELAIANADGSDAGAILHSDSVYTFLRQPAWAPDGRSVVIVRSTGGIAGELWLVPVTGGAPRRLRDEPASVFSQSPLFTPDGYGVVHSSNRGGATNLWVLPAAGGEPVRLTVGPGPDESPSIAASGAIAFVNSRWRGLLQAHDLAGGPVRTLVAHAPFMWAPALSPDGRAVAFSRSETDGSWHIWVVPIDGGTPRRLTAGDEGEVYPRWSAGGESIVFHTWSTPRRVGRVLRDGSRRELLSFGGENEAYPDVSPDDQQIAFVRADARTESVYVARLGGGGARPLTSSPATVPRWSPDGKRIVFAANRGWSGGIFTIAADGTDERRLTEEGGWPVWWPDGRQILYAGIGADGNQELRLIPANGGARSTVRNVKLVGTNHLFAVSADGRTIVATNSEHLSDEIWILERR